MNNWTGHSSLLGKLQNRNYTESCFIIEGKKIQKYPPLYVNYLNTSVVVNFVVYSGILVMF